MNYTLSNSEKEILDILWKKQRWTTCSELVDHFKEEKDWKRQTINTFLTHLVAKGLVVKDGRKYIYRYTEQEFESYKAAELVEVLYEGSIKKFISALTGKNKLSQKYADELKEYLDTLDDKE